MGRCCSLWITFVSLGNLFLGADWIWTFKFLCLIRQLSIHWLCFTSPSIWLLQNAETFSCSRMLTAAMQISWSNSNGNSVLHCIWELSERYQYNLGCNPYPQKHAGLCKLCHPSKKHVSLDIALFGERSRFLCCLNYNSFLHKLPCMHTQLKKTDNNSSEWGKESLRKNKHRPPSPHFPQIFLVFCFLSIFLCSLNILCCLCPTPVPKALNHHHTTQHYSLQQSMLASAQYIPISW